MNMQNSEQPKAATVYVTAKEYETTLKVLARALIILSTRWTNKGYKIKQEDGSTKCCVLGSIDLAKEQLGITKHVHSSAVDFPILFVNDTSLIHFKRSAVTINDDLGYHYVVRLFGLTIERLLIHATTTNTNTRGFEYRTSGAPS